MLPAGGSYVLRIVGGDGGIIHERTGDYKVRLVS
jgi:hypothetical protein